MSQFTHLNQDAVPEMVSIREKSPSVRTAVAEAYLRLPARIKAELPHVGGEFFGTKGAILQTANLAGIMAAKKTAELIPLCHNIPLDKVHLEFQSIDSGFRIQASAVAEGKTGVEMEALCAVTVAALTIYDMCKALSNEILIEQIQLLSKTGGKSDYLKPETLNPHESAP